MHRKYFMKPDVEDLKKGAILPIYTNYLEQQGLIGNARLIKYQPGWRPELPYIRAEIGGTDLQEPNTINWCFQRWIVEFLDGPQKGFRTARNIAYFLSIDSYLNNSEI